MSFYVVVALILLQCIAVSVAPGVAYQTLLNEGWKRDQIEEGRYRGEYYVKEGARKQVVKKTWYILRDRRGERAVTVLPDASEGYFDTGKDMEFQGSWCKIYEKQGKLFLCY